ncbi:MAG: type II toxin-antitoxin system PemK/MazF family toxin [Ruminococcus sp.]|nr:type II toxin-antitoxin system PemK/MazF family toxin [Ruminococcus sp.]
MEVKRGDIYYVAGTYAVGSEQSGERPAIIVSNDTGNKHAPVVEVVYLTTKYKNSIPTHVNINSAERPSTALCEQIVTVCKSRLKQYIGSVTEAEMSRVDKALQTSLGIQRNTGGNAMQITIKTPNGDMNFDMPQDKAMDIIQKAFRYTQEATVQRAERENESEAPTARTAYRPHRRIDSLFGDFRTENNRKSEETTEERQEYKGFLLIKCEECGKVRGFCVKTPTSEHRCECGHSTKLHDLKPAFVRCKCGGNYKYKTNITDEHFEYSCLNCGSPVDLELNNRRNTYVTIAD